MPGKLHTSHTETIIKEIPNKIPENHKFNFSKYDTMKLYSACAIKLPRPPHTHAYNFFHGKEEFALNREYSQNR